MDGWSWIISLLCHIRTKRFSVKSVTFVCMEWRERFNSVHALVSGQEEAFFVTASSP